MTVSCDYGDIYRPAVNHWQSVSGIAYFAPIATDENIILKFIFDGNSNHANYARWYITMHLQLYLLMNKIKFFSEMLINIKLRNFKNCKNKYVNIL